MYEPRNETYSFNFYDGNREILHRFTTPEGMTYEYVLDKFYDFLSGVYGYEIRDTRSCSENCKKESIKDYIE